MARPFFIGQPSGGRGERIAEPQGEEISGRSPFQVVLEPTVVQFDDLDDAVQPALEQHHAGDVAADMGGVAG
jgi:hypothetical protein